MIAANRPLTLMAAQSRVISRFKSSGSLRTAAFIVLVGLLAATLYLPSSATSFRKHQASRTANAGDKWKSSVAGVKGTARARSLSIPTALNLTSLLTPFLSPEGIATFAADCTTPKTSFNLGEVVCAKASGVPVSVFPWKVAWLNTSGLIVQSTEASPDDAHQYFFTLPSTPSSVGSWKVNLLRSNGAVRQSATFTVSNTAQATADVLVQKLVRNGENSASVGSSLAFLVLVVNAGPDAAQNVHLVDSVPPGSTLASFSQQSGPACVPANSSDCTMASLAYGDRAEFTAVYLIGGSPSTVVTSSRVTSTTADSNSDNNNSFVQFDVTAGGGGSPCSLICPTGISRPADGSTGHFVMSSAAFDAALVPVATGSCGVVTKSITPDPTTNNYTFPIGVNVITFETASGETCTTTLTVADSLAPTVSCPSDITVFESSAGSGAVVNFTVNVTDDSGTPGNPAGLATLNCDHQSGSNFAAGTTPVTCTASDGTNTSAACTFNVIVNAVSTGGSCVLTPPSPIVVDSAANTCGANVNFDVGATDCGTVTCDHPSGSFFPGGETLVTCTSSPDGTSTSFTVTVNDVTAPVPTVNSLPTLSQTCSVTAGVPTTIMTPTGPKTVIELPTATDNCGGVISGSTDERTFDEPGSHVVTWTYTDGSGNTSTQTQTVIVTGNDTAAPVPDVANLPTVTGECEVTVNPPTATDNCAGTVTATTPDQLTYTAAGTYTIHWTYSDGTGNTSGQNQTVVVTDVQAPTIALDGPSSVTIECHTTYVDPGVTTADNCAPENVHVTTTGLPNTNVLGTYTVTYTATDSGGNQASVQRTVIVQDTTAPTITAPANVTVGTGPGASTCSTVVSDAQLGNATAGDNCSVTVTRSGVPAGNIFPKGNTTVTYTATDGGGNTATATQVVTVNDTTLPTISCQANIVADFDGAVNGAVVTYTTPAGADNCAGATTTQIAGLPSGATFPAGTTTNTFRVTDASGNAAECSFNVTVAVTSLIGLDSVTITGSAFADSYNSGGGYPATKTSLANVLSNGTITMGNSAKVWGNVRSTRAGVNMTGATNVTGNATAGTTVATSGSATVSGTRTNNALAPVMTLPPVSACAPFSPNSGISGTYSYNASTGDLTLSGVNIATLANGTYCFHNVTLGNSAQLKVNGPVVIKLTGTLNTSGATFINNTTQIPSNLRILSSYSGSNGVVLGNSASIYSVIYAPNTGLNISGAAPLFGTAAGKSITLGGSGAIHYDTTLLSIWPALWTLIVGP